MAIKLSQTAKKTASVVVSVLGAAGVALQNYIAVGLFLRGLVGGLNSISRLSSGFIHAAAIGAGGLCSGMVNYFINLELLEGFLARISSQASGKKLSGWRKLRYYAGIFVFSMTGVLFGMTTFAFSAATPLALLALAAGVFVAIIMTIQEIETWLQSFDDEESDEKTSLFDLFKKWKSTLTFGKLCGHIIAAGNVLGLSLLFTLGLTDVLVAASVAAFPAFVIGLAVAFTFGAFTEFYFYNFFLSKFCQKFQTNWEAMKASHYAGFGFLCIGINAFVNAALTYSGVGLLTGAFVLAGLAMPPVGVIVALSAVSALFAGSASFVLGMDFWIRKQGATPVIATITQTQGVSSISKISNTAPTEPANSTYDLGIYAQKKSKISSNLSAQSTAVPLSESMAL
jgi:hypothetical protein